VRKSVFHRVTRSEYSEKDNAKLAGILYGKRKSERDFRSLC